MAKKSSPAKSAGTPALKTKVADPVAAAPVAPPAPIVEKSEVKGSGRVVAKAPPAPRTLSYDEVAKRAYEIYASRGYARGNPQDDWYEAERQLRAGL